MGRIPPRAKRVLRVRQVMRPIAATISPETRLEEAANLFASRGLLGAPVVDGSGRIHGSLTDTDILLFIRSEFRGLPRFRFITWRARVRNLLLFLDRHRPGIAVRVRARLRSTRTSEILENDRLSVGPNDDFGPVSRYMFETKTTIVPVVDEGRVVGVVGYDAVIRGVYQGLAEGMSG